MLKSHTFFKKYKFSTMNIFKSLLASIFFFLCGSYEVIAQNTAKSPNKEVTQTSVKTIDLLVDGMTCQKGCADGIDKKLKTVSGVLKSRTKLDTGISSITYDETKIKVTQLISIIEERGYTAKIAVKHKKV